MAIWRPERPKDVVKRHFSGARFDEEQPFETFVKNDENHAWVVSHVAGLCPDAPRTSGLEVGPGDRPVLSALPFRSIDLVESSPALADHLGRLDPRHRVIYGGIHDVDLDPSKPYGVGVMCEVLTHIRPSQRLAAVERLANGSNAIVLLDRTKPRRREALANVLKQIAKRSRASIRKTGNAVMMRFYGRGLREDERRSARYVAPLMKTLVDFAQIAKALHKAGWVVETEGRTYNEEHYTLLKAWRPMAHAGSEPRLDLSQATTFERGKPVRRSQQPTRES